MNIHQAHTLAAEITAALNALGIKGTHDQDIAAIANEGFWFWDMPTSGGRVFACLSITDASTDFSIDVRDRDEEPRAAFGTLHLAGHQITAAALAGAIARSAALAEYYHPIG